MSLTEMVPDSTPRVSVRAVVAAQIACKSQGVSDGIRTRDRLDHNQELYRLSYAHRGVPAGQ